MLTAHEYAKAKQVYHDRTYQVNSTTGRGYRMFPCAWPTHKWVLRFDINPLLAGKFEKANITLTREPNPKQLTLLSIVFFSFLWWYFSG